MPLPVFTRAAQSLLRIPLETRKERHGGTGGIVIEEHVAKVSDDIPPLDSEYRKRLVILLNGLVPKGDRIKFDQQARHEAKARNANHTRKLVDAMAFRGKLLLMFGSADDNVRIVNSMQYLAKLHSEAQQFDMMVYPNMNHSINGCGVRLPLYQRVLNFFDQHLK